ncbi:hypothetical protein V6N13_050048 [Hibiscus sabdariffa]|uniref:Uncharacterized protein n=1 Tax=Hibiscus sabdariffa TaxID=183260 RepID=A0ABR2QVK1_9ROSI
MGWVSRRREWESRRGICREWEEWESQLNLSDGKIVESGNKKIVEFVVKAAGAGADREGAPGAVVNVIVIFLVGESRVINSSNKSPAGGDVYDEYIERSQSRVRGIEAGSDKNKWMDCKEEMVKCESESTEDVVVCEFELEGERTCENGSEIVEDKQIVELPA